MLLVLMLSYFSKLILDASLKIIGRTNIKLINHKTLIFSPRNTQPEISLTSQ